LRLRREAERTSKEEAVQEPDAWITRAPWLAQVGVLAALYFVAAKLSLPIAIPPGYATAVWPPSGIALAAVLVLGIRVAPGIWIGAALAKLTVETSPFAAVFIAAGNTLEALAGAALIGRWLGTPYPLERAEHVIGFVAIAALIGSVAATIALIPLAIGHVMSSADVLSNWLTWWQGDVTGIIVVTPLILSWGCRRCAAWPPGRLLEVACFGVLLLAITFAVFGKGAADIALHPHTFVILPFIVWAALRFGQREVTTTIAVVCAIAVWFTVERLGPFALAPLNESVLLLLAFVSVVAIMGLLLSAVVGERGRAMDRLERALREVREQAMTDPLTSLLNRRHLFEILPRELIRARRRGNSCRAHHDRSRPLQAHQRRLRAPGRRPRARSRRRTSQG
jgi:integral membrane sensor domain MASE1